MIFKYGKGEILGFSKKIILGGLTFKAFQGLESRFLKLQYITGYLAML